MLSCGILNFLLNIYEEFCLNFDGDCIECVHCFWFYNHSHNINPTKPRTWENFSSSDIFFYLSMFNFMDLLVLLQLSQVTFEVLVKGLVSLTSVSVCHWCREGLLFLCVSFLYCFLAKCGYQLKEFPGWHFRVIYVCNHIICKSRYFGLFLSYIVIVISFSCLISLGKTSSIILEKYGVLSCCWF